MSRKNLDNNKQPDLTWDLEDDNYEKKEKTTEIKKTDTQLIGFDVFDVIDLWESNKN